MGKSKTFFPVACSNVIVIGILISPSESASPQQSYEPEKEKAKSLPSSLPGHIRLHTKNPLGSLTGRIKIPVCGTGNPPPHIELTLHTHPIITPQSLELILAILKNRFIDLLKLHIRYTSNRKLSNNFGWYNGF
jgi:hypothetical protein